MGLCEYTAARCSPSFRFFLYTVNFHTNAYLNSRFEIKFWIVIDTNTNILQGIQWRSGDGCGPANLKVRSSKLPRGFIVVVTTMHLQIYKMLNCFSVTNTIYDLLNCFSVTNTDWFFCFIQLWVQTWTDGASLGKKDKPTTIGPSAASYSWIFSQSPKDFCTLEWFLKMYVRNQMTVRAEFLVKKPWRTQRKICVFVCVFTCVISEFR